MTKNCLIKCVEIYVNFLCLFILVVHSCVEIVNSILQLWFTCFHSYKARILQNSLIEKAFIIHEKIIRISLQNKEDCCNFYSMLRSHSLPEWNT